MPEIPSKGIFSRQKVKPLFVAFASFALSFFSDLLAVEHPSCPQ